MGNAGGGLLVGQLTEHGLVLHNSDEDELGLLGLDQRGDVVEAVLEDERLGLGNLLALGTELSLVPEPVLLGLLGLGLVVLEELVQVLGGGRVERLCENVNRGRDTEALGEDALLALKTDVLGPLDEPGQVPGR